MKLRLENARVRLGGREVLSDITLEPAEGMLTAVLGPNGAGKSTLLRALAGLAPLEAGRLFIGEDEALSRRETARRVAWLPQHADIPFPFPIEEVVMMGRYPHLGRFGAEGPADVEAVGRALAQVDAADLRGRPFTRLSGGERKRGLLARTLATEAPILLLDEPTADLDIRHALEFLRTLKRSGRTVVMAIHDLNLAARACDRFVLLERGRQAGDALTPELVERVFGVRARLGTDPHLTMEPRPEES